MKLAHREFALLFSFVCRWQLFVLLNCALHFYAVHNYTLHYMVLVC